MNDAWITAFVPSVKQLHMTTKPPLPQGLAWEAIFVAVMIVAAMRSRLH